MNNMSCTGDGWHKVGTNCKVLVENRVIVKCFILDSHGNWTTAYIKRWNNGRHNYERTGMVTLAALRSGISRSTMTIG